MHQQHGITLDVVANLADQQGLVVLPRRWDEARTCAWLGHYRRSSTDDEHRTEYSAAWVYIASIARMFRKLHPNTREEPPYKRKKQHACRDIIAPLHA